MELFRLLLLGLLPLGSLSVPFPDFTQFNRTGPRGNSTGGHSGEGRHIKATLQSQKVENVTSGSITAHEKFDVSNRSPREPLARYGAGIVYMLERAFIILVAAKRS